jgi:hypothetical protein
MGKPMEIHEQTIGKPWESHWKYMGGTMGKPLEIHGKFMCKPFMQPLIIEPFCFMQNKACNIVNFRF